MDHTLKLLKQMAHGIAKQFGTSCEVVIHDLNKNLETSIVHIENGQVTNRKSGDGPSGIVLETLHKNAAKVQDKLSYLTRTEDGRILKSSTLYIRDADEQISYIFSINYDITALLTIDSALGPLLHSESGSPGSYLPWSLKPPVFRQVPRPAASDRLTALLHCV